MKRIRNLSILLSTVAFITLNCTLVSAQGDHVENVDVIAPYQPIVSDAFKINLNPVIRDTAREKLDVKYVYLNPTVNTTFTVEELKPAKIGAATVPKLYRFLIKVGFGNYTTPYGEFYFNNKQSRTYSIGVHMKHFSSWGEIKDYADPSFMDNTVDVYGRKIFKKHVFSGELGYDYNMLHYYGFKPADYFVVPDKDEYQQHFSMIKGRVNLSSLANPDSLKLNHKVDLAFHNLGDAFGTNETNLFLSGDVNKELSLIRITQSQVIGGEANVDYTFQKDSLKDHNHGLIRLKPYLRTKFKAFAFNLGVDLTLNMDTSSSFHIYPIADVQFNIVRDILILYGGITGSMKNNTYRSMTAENPFMTGMSYIKPTNERMVLFAGIRSNISKEVSASLNAKA